MIKLFDIVAMLVITLTAILTLTVRAFHRGVLKEKLLAKFPRRTLKKHRPEVEIEMELTSSPKF
jgi:hypothetical protein